MALILVIGIIPSSEPVDPEAYCPVGGLQAITTYVVNGSLPCSMSTLQIMMGLVLAFGVMLFSKLFCAYICPLGTFQDIITMLRNKLHFKGFQIRQGSILDKIFRIFKYLLLFWVFYMTATASELFCKNFDPYYAVATGFKGEITIWMTCISMFLLIVPSIFVDRFWCRYLCPLGAASNTLKFWGKTLILFAVCYLLVFIGGKLGFTIPWWVMFAAFCLLGYIQELFGNKPKLQVLNIIKDDDLCTHCGLCTKACPYHIDVAAAASGRLEHVDCMLCGECTAACPTKAIQTGVSSKAKGGFWTYLPIILVVVLFAAGIALSKTIELATINDIWGLEQENADGTITQVVKASDLQEFTVEGLRSVKCYGSSKALSAKLQRINGVHGVRTYVKSGRAVISYDPAVTNEESIQQEMFVPSRFKVATPDYKTTPKLKCVVVRTEKMSDKLDLNMLGLQMRLTDKKIYGLESEFACPLIVRVYMDPEEEVDEKWFKEVIEKKDLVMPLANGGEKVTPLGFEFVRLEEGYTEVGTEDFIKSMFQGFNAVYKKNLEKAAGKDQYVYTIVDNIYEKPFTRRNIPYLSSHLSSIEGVLSVSVQLTDELEPALMIKYAEPMTEDALWEALNAETWSITYTGGEVKQEAAKMHFKHKGVSTLIK